MEWPLLETGDRRFRVDDDKYLKNLEELSAEVHKYVAPSSPSSTIAVLGAASTLLSPREWPPRRSRCTPVRRPRRRAATRPHHRGDRGIGRSVRLGSRRLQQAGWDGIEINAAADHLFHSFLSRFWNKRTTSTARRAWRTAPASSCSDQRDQEALRTDFPLQLLMNASRSAPVTRPHRRGRQGDRPHLRGQRGRLAARALSLSGMHQGSYLPDNLFYPSLTSARRVPQGDGLEPQRGVVQRSSGGGYQAGGRYPGDDGGRFDADSAEKVLSEARRTISASTAASSPTMTMQQDTRRPRTRRAALHQVRPLQQYLQRGAALPHQRLLRHRLLRLGAARPLKRCL